MTEEHPPVVSEAPRTPMSETDKLKLIIAALIIVLFVIGVYYFSRKDTALVATPVQQVAIQNQAATTLDWTTHQAELVAAFKDSFSSSDFQSRGDAQIVHAVDVTGDGVPEAFVDLGAGGASNELIGIAGYIKGQVVVLGFRLEDGTLEPAQLIEGAAALHKENVGVDAPDHAVYQGEVMYKQTGAVDTCTATAYQWDDAAHVFAYNSDLSARLTPEYCSQISKPQ